MAKKGTRQDDASLRLRPEPPAKRKKVSRLKITGLGVAARIGAVLTCACMFLPWLSAPGMNVLAQFSWMFGLYIRPGEFLFPMFNTGEMAEFLDAMSGSGMYGPVWAVFLICWGVGLVLLVARFIQSLFGLRETRRLSLAGFIAGGVAVAWAIAVLLLNVQYMDLFEQAFGLRFTVFEIPPGVIATAIFGIATGILARLDKNQPFVSQ